VKYVVYKLLPPEGTLTHHVFHVSLLKKNWAGDQEVISSNLPAVDEYGKARVISIAKSKLLPWCWYNGPTYLRKTQHGRIMRNRANNFPSSMLIPEDKNSFKREVLLLLQYSAT
jgi:hypothetical protein